VLADEKGGCIEYAPLLVRGNGRGIKYGLPPFHLDKDQHCPFAHNQVDLAKWRPPAPRNQAIAPQPQPPAGNPFAAPSLFFGDLPFCWSVF